MTGPGSAAVPLASQASAWLPVLLGLPALGALLLLAVPRLSERSARIVGVAATGATLVAALAVTGHFDIANSSLPQDVVDVPWLPSIGVRFSLAVDGLSLPLIDLSALLFCLCAVYTWRRVPEPGRVRLLMGLLCLIEVGVLATFCAHDLILFFVFFEVVLIPMWFLIAIWGGRLRRAAATKFILFTLLGSGLMLVGFLLIGFGGSGDFGWFAYSPMSNAAVGHAACSVPYLPPGSGAYASVTCFRFGTTFDMSTLAFAHGAGLSHGTQVAAAILLVLGFGIKAPMWPLHTWLPDAHTEAPTVGSVLLAGVLLKLGTYGLLRIAVPELPYGMEKLAPALGVLAVAGIVYAALACLAQRDLKRLIAFSSVGHMGFVLLGIATLTPVGLDGAMIGNVAHGLITGLLFFLAGAIKDRYGTADLDELGGGLLATMPPVGRLMVFAGVASLGLPGLAGFWGEFLAMVGAWRPAPSLDRPLFIVLLGFAAAGTVLATLYIARMLRRVAYGVVPAGRRDTVLPVLAATDVAAWVPLAVGVLALGLWPRLVLGLCDATVHGLLR